jgi:hypothetical protein
MRNIYFLLITFLFAAATTNAQECGVIYVSPTGATSGATGTKANPADLAYGLSLVSPSNNKVYLATGVYTISNPLTISSDITIEGGFSSVDWSKSNAAESIIHRDNSNVEVLGNALVALKGAVASNFRLQDLTIEVEDAPTAQGSVYGIYLYVCSNYQIVRCKIITGEGGDGDAVNTPGADGLPGSPGANGTQGNGNTTTFGTGGDGGAGGGTSGGTFGLGGASDASDGQAGGTPSFNRGGGGGGGGAAGGVGSNNGGTGGDGGGFSGANTSGGGRGNNQGNTVCNAITDCNNDLSGDAGANGTNGIDGANGGAANQGLHFNGFYNPGSGAYGANGTGGQGGKGGGGGGGEDNPSCVEGAGSGGGGGGGGGEGGEGGQGGQGGGGSYCIYTVGNGTNGYITHCKLQNGAGGTGGAGAPGGQGGTGGLGGFGGSFDDGGIGCGGDGGKGGDGGDGGAGGQGPDGESQKVHHDGIPATVSGNTIPGNPPVITVTNPGCINASVQFTGSVNAAWDFGADANPQTATGTWPPSVTYSTTGRKTIVYNGVTFTDYINIYNNAPSLNLPSISASLANIYQGCPVKFNTSLIAGNYSWNFGSEATPPYEFGPSLTNTGNVVFNTPGTYTIYLSVPTSCCGDAVDSLVITVNPLSLELTPSPSATVCQGETVTFMATSGFSTYAFLNGNTPVQSGAAATYTNPNLASGSNMSVAAILQGCTLTSNVVVYTVYPTPAVALGNDAGICSLATLTLDAGSFASYLWSPGNETTQTITVGTGTYSVAVTDVNGCNGSDEISIIANSNILTPGITPAEPLSLCAGTTALLNAGNGYTSYLWSPGNETTQTITAGTGTYYVAVTDANGCTGTDEIIITASGSITPVVLASGPFSLCAGDNVILDAGNGYDTYLWSPGNETTQTLTVTTGGNYSVTVTDNGCSVTSNTVAVDFAAAVSPTIITSGNNICVADTFCNYQWMYNDTLITGATDNCYDITESGSFRVEVTTCSGCTGISPVVDLAYIGVEEQDFANHISVYPNPTDGNLVLELEFDQPENLLIRLTDVTGRELNAPVHLESVRSLRKEISLTEFSEGFYFLVLEKNDVRLVKKVLKK